MYKILFSAALLFSTSFSYAQSSRLVSEMRYMQTNGQMKKMDTTNYTYSWGHGVPVKEGSALWGNDLKFPFDEAVTWGFDVNGGLFNLGKAIQQFDTDDRLIVTDGYSWISNNWVLTSKKTYHYTNDQVDTIEWTTYNNGVVSAKGRFIYTYGQYGMLTQLDQQWDDVQGIYLDKRLLTNTYNLSGQYIKGHTENFLPNQYEHTAEYTYSGNNIDSLYNWSDNGNTSVAKYTYDGNNDLVQREIFYTAGSGVGTSDKYLGVFDSNHNMLSLTRQYKTTGQYVNDHLYQWTYNSFNQMTMLSWKGDWDGTQFQHQEGDRIYYYHYETYDPLSTGSVVKQNVSLQVFPNPANNTINIQSFAEHKQVFGVTIYDVTGKSVKHWNEAPTSMYQKQVDVSSLPSGNYFLRIDNGEMVKFMVVK